MCRFGRSLFLTVFACQAAIPASAAAPTAGAAEEGWTQMADWHFNESLAAFDRALSAAAPGERALVQLGRAAALMNSQPRLPSKLAEAQRVLEEIAAGHPGTDEAMAAEYLLARLENDYRRPGDFARAAAIYRRVIDREPGHFFAQLALSKYAFVRLYEAIAPGEQAARFAELEALGTRLTLPFARRNFHYLMGDAAMRFGLSRRTARDHYRQAIEAGIPFRRNLADAYLRVAEISVELDEPDEARRFYQRYLDEFPIETRRKLIEDRLAALPPPSTHGT